MDPTVTQHLDAGARTLTIAQDFLHYSPSGVDQPAFEWVVIISFYSAVRNVNAYIQSLGRESTRSHIARAGELASDFVLASIRDGYLNLSNGLAEPGTRILTASSMDTARRRPLTQLF